MFKSKLPAIHPGDFLAEMLSELKLTQTQFANAINISSMRVSHLIRGARPVTAELALLMGRAFGQTPQYWLNLQSTFDLRNAEVELGDAVNDVHVLVIA
jgi:antitoxin HigA-1